jgi:WD40 repeat protein
MKTFFNEARTRAFIIVALISLWILPSAKADYFTNTAAMNWMRSAHVGTLLANGKALVFGGYNSSATVTNTAELYDANSGTWTATGLLATKRAAGTATLLQNGKVLAAGGISVYFPNTLAATDELYDPATGTWATTGPMTARRYVHGAVRLNNGKVLVVGGSDGTNVFATCELYDPITGLWSATGSLGTARRYHTVTLLQNGKVLAVGGQGVSSAELYDPVSGTWSLTAPSGPREQHTATLLPNGKVLVAAGANTLGTATLYDPNSGTWTPTGNLTQARYSHTDVLLANGKVLVLGGFSSGSATLASAELYDPATGTWAATSSLNFARVIPIAIVLPNEKVLVAGGGGTGSIFNVLSNSELYVTAALPLPPILLKNPTRLANGAFQFGFTNTPATAFVVAGTTNISQARSNWLNLGNASEISAGQYQFIDFSAVSNRQRFYTVHPQ